MSKKFHSDISFPDDNKIKLGTGEDAEIYVNNDELIIQNTTSDKDIVFNINDGGSTVEAIRIDAENSRIGFFNSSPSKVVSITGTFQASGESFFNNFDVTNGSSASRFRDGHVVHFNTNRTANIFTTSDDLYITNGEDDKDVLFRCDDGAGGVETYFRLDGSAATHDGSANTAKFTVWGDNSVISLGDGNDLRIYHSGTSSFISNFVGNFYIDQNLDDGDIIFRCDDGSGGLTEYFRLDGGAAAMVASKSIYMNDNKRLYAGGGGDLGIYHDGTDNYIDSINGDLYIRNTHDDKDIIFQSDNGSGGVETYFFLDGSSSRTIFPNGKELVFGTSNNLFIFHSTHSYIQNYTSGTFYIDQRVDDADLVLRADDGSGGTTAYLTLDGSATTVEIAKATNVADNVTATKASDVKFEAKATTAGAFFKANSVGNGYFGIELFNDSTAKWFVGTYADHASIGANDFAIVSGSKVDGEIRFKIDSSGDASFTGAATVAGNLTANGNIIGDDSTNITNISRIEADAYAADADNTTIINMSATQIDCLVADTDVFQITDSDFTFDPAVKVSLHKRNLAKTSNTDADADGDIVYFGSTTSMDAGKIYYFTSSGTWALADADAESTAKGMLAVALGSASNTNGMLIRGMVTLDHDPGTIGDTVFLSTTAGQASSTAPSGNGDIVRVIGYCLDSTNGQIYFNPDGTFVEVTA